MDSIRFRFLNSRLFALLTAVLGQVIFAFTSLGREMHTETPTVCSLCSLPFLGETNIAFKQLHHEMHIEPLTSSKSCNVERKVSPTCEP